MKDYILGLRDVTQEIETGWPTHQERCQLRFDSILPATWNQLENRHIGWMLLFF